MMRPYTESLARRRRQADTWTTAPESAGDITKRIMFRRLRLSLLWHHFALADSDHEWVTLRISRQQKSTVYVAVPAPFDARFANYGLTASRLPTRRLLANNRGCCQISRKVDRYRVTARRPTEPRLRGFINRLLGRTCAARFG